MTETRNTETLRQRLVSRTASLRSDAISSCRDRSAPLRRTFSSLRDRSIPLRGSVSSLRDRSIPLRGSISSWRQRGIQWRRTIASLRGITWDDVVVFFPRLANRLKAHWRRRQDNADLVKTMNSIEGEEAKMENVFNLVDELDWLKTDLLAQHCGDEVAMPLLDASMTCWNAIDRILAPLKNECDSEEDIFGSLPSFEPIPPPRKVAPVPPPRRYYSGFVNVAPVPPPRKKHRRVNMVRNVKAPPRPPRRNRGRKIKILRVQQPFIATGPAI